MKLLILLISSIVLLILCYATSKRTILTPQFGFIACFIPSFIYAFSFKDVWELNMSEITFWVLFLGLVLFALFSTVLQLMLPSLPTLRLIEKKPKLHLTRKIYGEKWKLLCFLGFQGVVLLWCIRVLMHANGGLGTLTDAIFNYKHSSFASTEDRIRLPGLLILLRTFCYSSGYVWLYILLYNLIYKNKLDKMYYLLLLGNVVCSTTVSILFGSRNGAIQLIIAGVVQAYFINGRKNRWQSKLKVKTIALIVILGAAGVFSFQAFGNMLGRNSTYESDEYLAIYLSAEIKNLDTFVREGKFGAPVGSWQTLIYVVNFISTTFDIPEIYHQLDLPFRQINGHNLGNVYTIFYAYIYDGGFAALIIFTLLMALVCQLMFLAAKRQDKSNSQISLAIITYSYVFFAIVFSFFSNKFYETVFNISFIRAIISWLLVRFYMENLKVDAKFELPVKFALPKFRFRLK